MIDDAYTGAPRAFIKPGRARPGIGLTRATIEDEQGNICGIHVSNHTPLDDRGIPTIDDFDIEDQKKSI